MTEREFVLNYIIKNGWFMAIKTTELEVLKQRYKEICENTSDEKLNSKEEAEDFTFDSKKEYGWVRIKYSEIDSISKEFEYDGKSIAIYCQRDRNFILKDEEKDRFIAWFEEQKKKAGEQ
jgi:hypothetical protein